MLQTPSKLGRKSLGEPTRIQRYRDHSPGAQSCGSADDSSAVGHSERPLLSAGGALSAGRSRTGVLHPTPSGAPHSARQSRDPRPVGDKIYAWKCAQNVTEFLTNRNYGKHRSADMFYKDPTTKEFFDVFRFLFGIIDPRYEFKGDMAQEVHDIMKRLKYPTEVNKSKMQAVNGPNTWPQLLAVLDWLIELIKLSENYIQPLTECDEGIDAYGNSHLWLMNSIQESYPKFLAGKDDQEEDMRLQREIEERSNAIRQEVERLVAFTKEQEEKLIKYQTLAEELVDLQAQPEMLRMEAAREEEMAATQRDRSQRLDTQCQHQEDRNQANIKELERLHEAIKEVERQVEDQAFSKRDIERMKSERNQLYKMNEDLERELQNAEHQVWELAMKEKTRNGSIDRLLRRAASCVGYEEGLIPRVDINEPSDVLASLDLNDVRQRLDTRSKELAQELENEEAQRVQLEGDISAGQQRVADKEREINYLTESLDVKRRTMEDNRLYNARQVEDMRRLLQTVEEQVHQLSLDEDGPTENQAAGIRSKVDELRLEEKTLRARFQQEVDQMKDQIRWNMEEEKRKQKSFKDELEQYGADVERTCRHAMMELQNIIDDPDDAEACNAGPRSAS